MYDNRGGRMAAFLILCALVCAAFVGCGEDESSDGAELPAGAVAKVRDRVFTQAAVQRAVVGQIAIRHSAKTMPPYLPADIEGCVSARAKRVAAEGQSQEQLRRGCERDREQREAEALGLLIRGAWYRLDYARRGMAVPPSRRAAQWASDHAGVGIENLRDVAGIYLLRLRPQRGGVEAYEASLRSRYEDDTSCEDEYDIPECR